MFVFAVVFRLKVAGLLHEVPAGDTDVGAAENPLSVARRPAGNFIADPTSARYVLEVTEMLAAKTMATRDRSNLAEKIQPPPLPRCDNHLALFKLCLYKDSTEKILRNLSNRPAKDMVTFDSVQEKHPLKKREISPFQHGEILGPGAGLGYVDVDGNRRGDRRSDVKVESYRSAASSRHGLHESTGRSESYGCRVSYSACPVPYRHTYSVARGIS